MTAYAAKIVNDYRVTRKRVACLKFDFAILNAQGTTFLPFAQLPGNAVVTNGALNVVTTWDGTTETASLGTSGAPTVLLAATTLKTAGSTAITVPAVNTAAVTYGITFSQTGTPTKGLGVAYIEYFLPDADEFSQGGNLSPNL
jgi:hypothetical protein